MRKTAYEKNMEKGAKWLAKSEPLYLQREGDAYYISDGHYIAQVAGGVYDAIFRTASPRFIELQDGEKAGAFDKKALPTKNSGVNLQKYMKDFQAEAAQVVDVTPYIMELQNGPAVRVMFRTDGERVFINNEYWQYLAPFGNGLTLFTGAKLNSPVISEGTETALLILPVNRAGIYERFEVVDRRRAAGATAAA